MGSVGFLGYTPCVLLPLMTTPQLIVSIVLVILSVLLALTILMHKNRGGGMSDLFGGGMSTSFGGMSARERNLDRITVILGVLWAVCIIGLLLIYRYFPG